MGEDTNMYNLFEAFSSIGYSTKEAMDAIEEFNNIVLQPVMANADKAGSALIELSHRIDIVEANDRSMSEIAMVTRADIDSLQIDIDILKEEIKQLKAMISDLGSESDATTENPNQKTDLEIFNPFIDPNDDFYNFNTTLF